MEIFKEYLDRISNQLTNSEENEIKILNYIKKIKEIIKNNNYLELIELERELQQERKTIKFILKHNFPLFIKYDNIYLEMIRIIKQILKKENL